MESRRTRGSWLIVLVVLSSVVGLLVPATAYARPVGIGAGATTGAQTTSNQRYAVDGGSVSGALAPLAAPTLYSGAGVHQLVSTSYVAQRIARPSYFVVQGVQQTGGWSYPLTATATAGGGVMVIQEAVNDTATTHTALMAAGAPTAQELKALAARQGSSAAKAGGPPPSCPSLNGKMVSPNLCFLLTRYVTRDTSWVDPIGITVTEVITQIVCSEYFSPSEVICSANDANGWDTGSAWFRVSHSLSMHYYNGQTAAEADSYAHFGNTQFPLCHGHRVDIYYSPNYAGDNASDHYYGGANTWKSSTDSCVNLLHEEYYLAVG